MAIADQARKMLKFGLPAIINIGSVAVAFATRLLVARLVGPAAFGAFSVWQNNVLLFGTLGSFGQQNHVIRELSREDGPSKPEQRRIALGALKLSLAASFAGAGVAVALFVFYQDGDLTAAWWQAAAIVAYAVMVILSALHRGLGSITVGISFDRILYPGLFLLTLLAGAAWIGGESYVIPACAGAMAAGAIASIAFLGRKLGPGQLSFADTPAILQQAKLVAPFFAVAGLFVLNGRYLLAFAGIFVAGRVLGEVALIFALASAIMIPAATLNLVLGPSLSRRLTANSGGSRAALRHLLLITAVTLVGVAVMLMAYPLAFALTRMELTIDPALVAMLSVSMGVMVIGNCLLIIEQFRGNAGAVARYFAVSMVAKLAIGYWIGGRLGLDALVLTDLAIGSLFLATMLARLIVIASTQRNQGNMPP